MAATASITIQGTIGGKSVTKVISKSADHANAYIEIPLPAGKELTGWTKVDANTATATLPTGHGYSTGTFDVYWVESDVHKQRHGVAGTIVADALSLDGGTGDDFPATATEDVVCCSQVTINVYSDGDEAVALIVCAEFTGSGANETAYCGVDFQDSAPATVKFMHLPPNDPVLWWENCIYTHPLTGNVIEAAKASNGSATYEASLSILILEDSTS